MGPGGKNPEGTAIKHPDTQTTSADCFQRKEAAGLLQSPKITKRIENKAEPCQSST